jgi:hypothetical protein
LELIFYRFAFYSKNPFRKIIEIEEIIHVCWIPEISAIKLRLDKNLRIQNIIYCE